MMEYKKLGNICNIVSGGTPSRSKSQYWDNGNIPWIKIRDIKSKYIEDSEEFITIEGLNNSSAKLLTKGTVLYTIFATLGEVGILKIDACANQAIAGLTVKDETKILPEYLYYYLKSKKNIVNKLGRGVAQNNINLSMLKEFEIEVIDIVKQNNIIKTLNYVDDIIKFKSLELKQLDELVKARFVELFGTLDNPTFNYNKSTLGELCYKITDGKHGGCSLIQGSNRYFVGAREIYDDKVHYENAPEISVDDFEKDYRRCNVEVGDFLIVNTGATIGKSAIATDKRTKHTLLQKSVALLKLNQDLLNPEFLKWCYRINTRMYLVESSSAQPNLLLSKIKATEIYVPPIELQNQFADFVKEVDKSRLEVQKSLKKTQELFDSLMQKYFG
ncbi:restriction endonuclease subunit S [Coprobacillus sp. AF27-24BH]|nr:restriction endonuclease subunit S [Coprobacillus sp. AF27-24BH]